MPAKMYKRKQSVIRKYNRAKYPVPIRPSPFGKYNEDFYTSIQVNGTLLASSSTIPNQSQIQFRDDGTGTT